MPATAGRVRMPHNNRVPAGRALATSDIWSKTIGHDPYAATENDEITETEAALHAEKTKTLLELAKHQNLGANNSTNKDGADDFARKMFLGLKTGKKRRRADVSSLGDEGGDGDGKMNVTEEMKRCLEAQSSSSEEEFVEEEEVMEQGDGEVIVGRKASGGGAVKKSSTRRKKRRKKKRSRDDTSSSSDDSSRERHRRRKRHRMRKEERRERRKRHDRKRRRKRDDGDDSSKSGGSVVESMADQKPRRLRDSGKRRRKRASSYSEQEHENADVP